MPAPARLRGLTARRRALAGGLVAAATLASTALATPAQARTLTPAEQMLAKVNQVRRAHHLRPLTLRRDIVRVADSWSAHMARTATLAHNPRLTRQIRSWRSIGENVGFGPDALRVEAAFLQSPHHRANILDRAYTQVGISVVRGSDGAVWITQDFCQPA